MRKHVAVVALVVVAIGFAACGGSGKASSKSSGSSGDDELSTVLEKAKTAKYKVTYQSAGDSPFTIAQDPPKFSYVKDNNATYVLADGSAVNCTGTGSAASCTQLPGGGESMKTSLTAGLGAFAALFLNQSGIGIPGLADVKTTSKKVAGRDATCTTIDAGSLGALSAALKGSFSVCVDKKTGIMLQTKADSGGGSSDDITATAFGDPSAADFTPPATPSTIPGQ